MGGHKPANILRYTDDTVLIIHRTQTSQSAAQETQPSNLFERWENIRTLVKKTRQITGVYTLINDNVCWNKSSKLPCILTHIFSGLTLLKTWTFSSQELDKLIHGRGGIERYIEINDERLHVNLE